MNKLDFWAGATVISYTRADAIADGVLIEVPPLAACMIGFTIPVAMTDTVYKTFVETHSHESDSENYARLHNLLFAVRTAVMLVDSKTDRVDFKHTDSDGNEHDLYALCHPGDDAEPVITIMFIGED